MRCAFHSLPGCAFVVQKNCREAGVNSFGIVSAGPGNDQEDTRCHGRADGRRYRPKVHSIGSVDDRTRHYGTFYGLDPADRADEPGDGAADLPILLVWGNCQAEAVRVLLASSPTLHVHPVRIPPVFELTTSDLGPLRRLLGRTSVLLSQPVQDGYRDLPLGTAEVASLMPAGSTVIRWPVVRCAALHPCQAIIRDPRDPTRDPPLVPYHDLRTLASARSGQDLLAADIPVEGCRTVASASLAELRRRERLHCDVAVSDVLERPRIGDMFTVNHPGNRVLLALAHRLQQAIGGVPDAADPARDLLGEVRAPVPEAASTALGFPGTPSSTWSVRGRAIAAQEIHRVQWQWYRENPALVDAGYARHEQSLRDLELA